MSDKTRLTDDTIHAAQAIIEHETAKDPASPLMLVLSRLAEALSSLTSAVEELEGQLRDLQNASGEDPGIQISNLKDSICDLERRIETLERQGD